MKQIEYPNLAALFERKSVAVIGASDDVKKPSRLPLKYAVDSGCKGILYPVTPIGKLSRPPRARILP